MTMRGMRGSLARRALGCPHAEMMSTASVFWSLYFFNLILRIVANVGSTQSQIEGASYKKPPNALEFLPGLAWWPIDIRSIDSLPPQSAVCRMQPGRFCGSSPKLTNDILPICCIELS